MKLLILGGTLYLGRHIANAALARGHDVTLFTRGRTHPELFPDAKHLIGDRDGNLEALRDHRWDAVIDTSGYLPRVVRASVEALAEAADHYAFVSSISVYADNTQPRLSETDPVAKLDPGTPQELTGETYGALKALCEAALEELWPRSALVVRPGLIFGPHDSTERSGYWPARLARGGEVLAPGMPGRPVQLIDVRDLADWMVRLSERREVGTYNATGPDRPLTMERFLVACREAAGNEAHLTWVDEEFLVEQTVSAFNELPVWVPDRYQAFETVDVSRAIGAGLTFRPLVETLRDTLAWHLSMPPGPREPKVGLPLPPSMTPAREKELLEAWKKRKPAPEVRAPASSR